MMSKRMITACALIALTLGACKKNNDPVTPVPVGKDPDKAEKVAVDRFSAAAGHLMVRDASNGLPGPNVAVNFDQGPFITKGLSPSGTPVEYYNFDVQPLEPAPIYVLMKNGKAVDGQLNIIDVIPGDGGYNDFWQVHTVAVPDDYVANTVTTYSEIMSNGYAVTHTDKIVNCPVVPEGSVASKRLNGESTALTRGWYKGKVVYYFNFSEKDLMAVNGKVPLSPIYVTFNVNPDQPMGGPASGFVVEPGTMQTHNVVATVPSQTAYSPLWSVNVYDNMDFSGVSDLSSAQMANILAMGVATVNCPIVSN